MEVMDQITIPSLGELPAGWTWKTMADIADVIGGGTPKTNDPSNYEGGKIPWITPADLSGYSAKHIGHGERFITEKGLKDSSARMMPAGTILFSSRAPVGYVAIASNPVCTNQGFKSFVLKSDDILPDYVYWWLKGNKELAESMASGTTFLELSGAKAKQLPVPIAPLNEQKLIVAEIEKQFSRLDEAVANLKRVKANLKRYKAAVLKAAVEGKLTEEWRKAHPNVEPASELLKRVLAERRRMWEENNPGKKNKEPDALEPSSLPRLPETWSWAMFEHVADAIDPQPSHRTPPELKSGIPYIGMGDIDENGKIDFERSRKVAGSIWKEHKNRYALKEGDFIFGKIGTIGKPVKLYPPFNYTLSANVVLIQPSGAAILPQYCFVYIDSPLMDSIIRNESRATTQAAFGIQKVRKIPIPIPPYDEQKQIILEVDSRLSIVRETEAQVDANLKRAESLRQAILKTAFSGCLVN